MTPSFHFDENYRHVPIPSYQPPAGHDPELTRQKEAQNLRSLMRLMEERAVRLSSSLDRDLARFLVTLDRTGAGSTHTLVQAYCVLARCKLLADATLTTA